MSVRAYRVITKTLAENPSFNIWHDRELLDFFEENSDEDELGFRQSESEGGSGEIEISVKLLELTLAKTELWKDAIPEDYRRKAIAEDIEFAKSKGDDYVMYECF